jgi:hypothetical protein
MKNEKKKMRKYIYIYYYIIKYISKLKIIKFINIGLFLEIIISKKYILLT